MGLIEGTIQQDVAAFTSEYSYCLKIRRLLSSEIASRKRSSTTGDSPLAIKGCSPPEELGQSNLGLHQGKSLANADACALPKCHPAARHMPVQALLLWASLNPALRHKLLCLGEVFLISLY